MTILSRVIPSSPKGLKTRSHIMVTAESLFADRGFDGASMGDIAAASGVLKSVLYHYFACKESLWGAVRDSVLSRIPTDTFTNETLFPTRRSLLMAVLGTRHRFLRANPHVLRFMRLDAARRGVTLHCPYLFPPYWVPAFRHLQSIQAIRGNLDPDLTLTFIVSSMIGALVDDYPVFHSSNKKRDVESYHVLLIDSFDRMLGG